MQNISTENVNKYSFEANDCFAANQGDGRFVAYLALVYFRQFF
jgi:hypothetical protein